MDTATAIQIALALLPLVQTGLTEFIAYIAALRSAAQQAGEWTDAQEAAFRASLFAATQDPAYQPDPEPPTS